MAFHEERFPVAISKRSRGGPTFRNASVRLDSGAVHRFARWDAPKRVYDAKYGIRRFDDGGTEDLDSVYEFWLAREGSLNSFRWKDWYDFSTASNHRGTPATDDVQIGVGDGSETQFQLRKVYTQGGYDQIRNLTKPVDGSVVVEVDGTALTYSTEYTVDHTSGIVTLASIPSLAMVVKAGCEFDVPAHFSTELDDGFAIGLDAFEAGEIPSIPIEEEIADLQAPHRFWPGGGQLLVTAAHTQLTWGHGLVVPILPSVSHKLYMPAMTYVQAGGPYHILRNASGSYTITVRDYTDAYTVASLTPGKTAITYVYVNSGAKFWGAYT